MHVPSVTPNQFCGDPRVAGAWKEGGLKRREVLGLDTLVGVRGNHRSVRRRSEACRQGVVVEPPGPENWENTDASRGVGGVGVRVRAIFGVVQWKEPSGFR